MGRAIDLFVTYRFLKLLTTPFEKTDAFKLGIIDDNGNPTKIRSTCSGEKNMYDIIPDKTNFIKHRVTDNHILTLHIRQHKIINCLPNQQSQNKTFQPVQC